MPCWCRLSFMIVKNDRMVESSRSQLLFKAFKDQITDHFESFSKPENLLVFECFNVSRVLPVYVLSG